MKSIMLISASVVFYSCSLNKSNSSDFYFASEAIAKSQIQYDEHVNKNDFYVIRKKLGKEADIHKYKFDTMYLAESFIYENGRYHGTLMTDSFQINYVYFEKKISFEEISYFPKIMIEDLIHWNFTNESPENVVVYPVNAVMLSRAIKHKGKFSAESQILWLYDKLP